MIVRGIIILILVMLFPGTAAAKDAPRLMVLPFAVYSQEDLQYLKKSVPRLLERRLESERIQIVQKEFTEVPDVVTEEWARKAMEASSADYGVYGSISKIGNRVSVDAVLISKDPGKEPESFFEVGMGLENLSKIMDIVVMQMARVIHGLEPISEITVTGNRRIEASAILAAAHLKKGDSYDPKVLDQDLKAIYKMGYFEDVSIDTQDTPTGKRIEIRVVEKPSVASVHISGNKKVETDDALEALNIKPYSILNQDKINEGIAAIKELYRKEGYLNAKITYKLETEKERTVSLVIHVEEGEKAHVAEILFTGNKAFPSSKLRKEMETTTKGWLSWIMDTGKLDMAKLRQDVDRISSFYFNHGYIRAKVGEPDVKVEGSAITITIPIDEGPLYKVGNVGLEGDFIKPVQELYSTLQVKSGATYNRELVRSDILQLRDAYADEGYAFAEVDPLIDINDNDRLVDITYKLSKGKKIYFERITVAGNTKTRDKVIRRELEVNEQGQFSSRKLRKSSENLHRLDYFETIDVSTSPGSDESKLNLQVEVAEKKTGTFSIGAGYSSVDGIIGIFDISQRNFLGRGERLAFTGQIGGRNQRFSLNFTEPWTFDIPLTTTFELYNWVRNFPDYDKDAIGGSIRTSYPIWRDLRASLKYRYEKAKVTDVSDDAAQIIQDQEGTSTTSSVTAGLRWDSRDKFFLTTRGSVHSFSIEQAGTPFGGSNSFTRYLASTGWYFPLFWGTVGYVSGEGGYITENAKNGLPLYEKFYLGGINSLRGFQRYSVSPKDPATGDQIGGTKMWVFTVEYEFPIIPKAGLHGVVFYDTGNVYADDDTWDINNMRSDAGLGIRWLSPMGPLRVEWGVNLSPEPGEDSNVFDFALGGTFD